MNTPLTYQFRRVVDFAFTGSVIVQLAAAAAMATFGLVVAALGKWRKGPLAFGIFAIGFALDGFGAALHAGEWAFHRADPLWDGNWEPSLLSRFLNFVGPLASVAGVVFLTRAYGVAAWGRPWIPWIAAGLVVVHEIVDGWWGSSWGILWANVNREGVAYFLADELASLVGIFLEPMMALGAIFLAVQYARRPHRNVAILAAGLIAFPASTAMAAWGLFLLGHSLGVPLADMVTANIQYVIFSILQITTIGAWIWANHRTGRRAALAVAGVGAGFALIGLVNFIYVDFGAPGLARIFDIGLVGYAILRYQYLGLDVKLRWTVSKTSVAAIFVAVFFVASEAAQQFFGDRFNNAYLGIAAAGLLVIAIAPLQRLGDRLAAKTVPISSEAAAQAYRHAVMAALRDDGRIGPREELHLAELAQRLEIGAADAYRIRQAAADR